MLSKKLNLGLSHKTARDVSPSHFPGSVSDALTRQEARQEARQTARQEARQTARQEAQQTARQEARQTARQEARQETPQEVRQADEQDYPPLENVFNRRGNVVQTLLTQNPKP